MYHCTRSQYGEIITNVDGNWNIIFKKYFESESIDWVKETLDLFSIISTKEKHNLDESFFQKNSDKLLKLIHNTKRMLEIINQAYIKLLNSENIIVDGKNIYFSSLLGADKTHLQPIIIEKDVGNEIGKKIEDNYRENKNLTIDLSDVESIEYEFSTDYRTFIGVLGFAIKTGHLILKPTKGCIVELIIS